MMLSMLQWLSVVCILGAGLVVWSLGPWVVRFCRQQGLVAPITARSSHQVPTPHGGGLLLPLVVVPLGLIIVWFWPVPFKGFLTVMLLASVVVAYVSWLDDRHELSAKMRLTVHLIAVAIVLQLLPTMFDFMPLWLEKLILMLAWGWFINLYNFMDGADGYASHQAVFIMLGLAILVPELAPIALLITAASVGMLRVNRAPAKIFLGDIGSTWLGFVMGGLLLLASVDDTWHIIWPLAALPMVFWCDATSTLLRRVMQGHKPWEPHKTFWFHRALALGLKHQQLVNRVFVLNVVIFACSVLGWSMGAPVIGFCISLLAVILVACYIRVQEIAQKKGFSHGQRASSR